MDIDSIRIEIVRKSSLQRGLIINSTITLERGIDAYLSEYFHPNDEIKSWELMELILSTDRITFDSKRQIMQYVVKKHNPDFLINHPNFFNDIERRIMPKRNIFAHYSLHLGPDALKHYETHVAFIKFKNENSVIWFSYEELKEHWIMIEENVRIIWKYISKS